MSAPCSVVTSSSLCPFDVDEAACGNSDDQFKLLFTPDVQNYPAYKQPASNPGQTFHNLIVRADGGELVPLTLSIPYPYVTHGAQPLHVYDGANVVGACVDSDGSPTGQPCEIDIDCGAGESCDASCFAAGEAQEELDVRWTIED